MKEWWDNFKEDLWVNLYMTMFITVFSILTILLLILCFKELITEIF